jgi:hypothetical protein
MARKGGFGEWFWLKPLLISRFCTPQPRLAVKRRRWSVRFVVWGARRDRTRHGLPRQLVRTHTTPSGPTWRSRHRHGERRVRLAHGDHERLGAGHGERPSMALRYVQSAGRGAALEVGKQRFGEANPPFSWFESAENGPRGRHRCALTTFVGSRAPGLQGSRAPGLQGGPGGASVSPYDVQRSATCPLSPPTG